MERDGRVLVYGQDVARNGGVFRATDGLLDRYGPKRVVDTPLSEGVIIGTAVGLAAEGLVPVPEIQFLGFAWQAFHQLAGQLARLRYRSDGRFDCPVTVRAPFGGGVRTPELHSEALAAQFVQCPGDRKSTRLNSSHITISYAVFCLKKKKKLTRQIVTCIKKKQYPPLKR